MEEENKTTTTTPTETTAQTYIDTIEQLKASTVSKDEYSKLLEENKKLIGTLARNETIKQKEETTPTPTLDELTAALNSDKEYTNLEYVTLSLAQRNAAIAAGKPDPYLPIGYNISPTEEDIAKANKVAKVFEELIDSANGSSATFTAQLQERLAPDSPQVVSALRKAGIQI